MKNLALALVGLCALAATGTARAGTHRVAIVVGHNHGRNEVPLRFAEADAAKFGRVLSELGGVDRADLDLFLGRPLGEVRAALERVREKVARVRAQGGDRVLVIFYFSGHSDGQALELGGEGLDFGALRNLLLATGADVELAIVDTCRSGALVAAKGGAPGPSFQIRLDDDALSSSGYVFLTSSAGDELALESPEIGGSFFTHHLISGMLGQADVSGDRRVSLGEAYDYAYSRTVADTARTTISTQHPNYANRLSGSGEIVLTELAARSAQLVLPTGFDRLLVTGSSPGEVLAEVPSSAPRPLALMPGRYAVRGQKGARAYAANVMLVAGDTRVVAAEEFSPAAAPPATSKGGLDLDLASRPEPRRTVTLAATVGARYGVFPGVAAAADLRLSVRGAAPSGFAIALDLTSGPGDGFVETTAFAGAGYHVGLERGLVRLFAGIEAGAGFAVRNTDGGGSAWSPLVGGAPHVGASLRINRALSVALEGFLAVLWVRDGHTDSAAILPGGRLGLFVDL